MQIPAWSVLYGVPLMPMSGHCPGPLPRLVVRAQDEKSRLNAGVAASLKEAEYVH
jgi:hypothetical protein